jgi:hypothetical protein
MGIGQMSEQMLSQPPFTGKKRKKIEGSSILSVDIAP